ncbi:MAG: hypothetical protein ACD_45C00620G0002 [uncultured bacterium]|nr:MAG: hypothetical protein ACD_45C00620G0002 [uncultured bacterium]
MMNVYPFKNRVLCLLFYAFCLSAKASAVSDELVQLLNNTQSMQAEFIQTVTDHKGKVVNQSSGRMAMQRPGKFRWETRKPNPQLIVTNGQRIWIYDPDLEQVTIRVLAHAAGETPALLLSNTNETLEKDFQVQATQVSSAMRWFLLLPKDKGSVFAVIKLGFANNQIKQMQLQDHLDHITQIRFNNVTFNKVLSPSLFTFKIPARVDVIDETK